MSWGTNKRNTIVSVFILILLLLAVSFAVAFFYEKPNCFDGKKNGDETGIDCGGSCELLCPNEGIDLIVHWQRAFKVAPGIYNVIAYVENQNVDAGAKNLEYEFRVLDEEGVTLDQRTGIFSIKPREVIPIIQNNLRTGELDVTRTIFEITSDVVWKKEDSRKTSIIFKDEGVDREETSFTRITTNILNIDVETISNIDFVVLVYDRNNNAIASSSTFVDMIRGNEEKTIVFTWPTNFSEQITRFEFFPFYE